MNSSFKLCFHTVFYTVYFNTTLPNLTSYSLIILSFKYFGKEHNFWRLSAICSAAIRLFTRPVCSFFSGRALFYAKRNKNRYIALPSWYLIRSNTEDLLFLLFTLLEVYFVPPTKWGPFFWAFGRNSKTCGGFRRTPWTPPPPDMGLFTLYTLNNRWVI